MSNFFVTPWTVASQAPLSMGFPRQDWSQLPGGSAVKRLPAKQEIQVPAPGQEDPLKKEMQPTPVFLPVKSHGLRSLAGLQSMGSQKSQTWFSDRTITTNNIKYYHWAKLEGRSTKTLVHSSYFYTSCESYDLPKVMRIKRGVKY